MNKLTSQLRAMGVGEDAIATATVGGRLVSEIDKPGYREDSQGG